MENNDSYISSKNVRMFYWLVLKHVIPSNQTVDRTEKKGGDTLSHEEWGRDFCESVTLQLEALLEPQNFQIAFDRKTGVRVFNNKQLTYFFPFLVSKVHEFKAEDIIIPNPGYIGFEIKASAMSTVQETLTQDIRDTLGSKMAIHKLVFSMATSRGFGFEIYYEGSFRVRRKFSDDDIESKGSDRGALESFFDEIKSAIEPFGFEITSTPSKRQRSLNNEYLFNVYYAPNYVFSEIDVHGEGCYAIRGDASTDDINEYGIDFDDTKEDETNAFLQSILDENLPPYTDLISCEINYVDDPGEAYEVDDELISYQKQAKEKR